MYSVMFFKNGKQHGAPTGPFAKTEADARNFAEGAIFKNGADSFAVHKSGSSEPVYVRKPNA